MGFRGFRVQGSGVFRFEGLGGIQGSTMLGPVRVWLRVFVLTTPTQKTMEMTTDMHQSACVSIRVRYPTVGVKDPE